MHPTNIRLQRLILGFWAGWYLLIVASNVCDAARALGWLPAGWRFTSGNLDAVRRATAIYGLGESLVAILFAAVVLWEFAALVAFVAAALRQGRTGDGWSAAGRAFLVSLGLWAAFILADELFVTFPTGIEGTHLRIFTAQLVSLLAVWSLDARTGA